jgi:hypothetical protein
MRYWKTISKLSFLALPLVCSPVFAEERVSLREIIAGWKASRMEQVVVRFSSEERHWMQATEDFELIPMDSPRVYPTEGEFRWIADVGIWLRQNNKIMNQIGDTCLTFQANRDREGMAGLQTLVVHRCSENNIVQSLFITGLFLYWLEPLSTDLFTSASKVKIKELQVDEHEQYGPSARLVFKEGGRKVSMTLVKQFGWRAVNIDRDKDGKPQSRIELKYQFDGRRELLLSKAKYTVFQDQQISIQNDVTFTEHVFRCQPEELEIAPPRHCLVIDYTSGSEEKRIVRKDGSVRPISSDEDRRAHEIRATWEDIIATEEGELFGPTTSHWRPSYLWFAVAAFFLVIAGVYFFREMRGKSP